MRKNKEGNLLGLLFIKTFWCPNIRFPSTVSFQASVGKNGADQR